MSIFVNMHNVISQEYFYWDSLSAIYLESPELLKSLFPKIDASTTNLQQYIRYVAETDTKSRLEISRNLNSVIRNSHLSEYFLKNLRPLNLSELEKLSQNLLVSIGNHSYSHPTFGNTDVDLHEEIFLNHTLIEESTGRRPKEFAFPFGTELDKSQKAEKFLVDLQYRNAFSTKGIPNSNSDNPMFKPRLVIGDWGISRYLYRILRSQIAYVVKKIFGLID